MASFDVCFEPSAPFHGAGKGLSTKGNMPPLCTLVLHLVHDITSWIVQSVMRCRVNLHSTSVHSSTDGATETEAAAIHVLLCPVACCFLPVAYCLLHIAYCLVPGAGCLLDVA